MPTFIVRAVQRSADGKKAAHVADKWPFDVPDLAAAKAEADRTPTTGWGDADAFEVASAEGYALAHRPIAGGPGSWQDVEAPSTVRAEASD